MTKVRRWKIREKENNGERKRDECEKRQKKERMRKEEREKVSKNSKIKKEDKERKGKKEGKQGLIFGEERTEMEGSYVVLFGLRPATPKFHAYLDPRTATYRATIIGQLKRTGTARVTCHPIIIRYRRWFVHVSTRRAFPGGNTRDKERKRKRERVREDES